MLPTPRSARSAESGVRCPDDETRWRAQKSLTTLLLGNHYPTGENKGRWGAGASAYSQFVGPSVRRGRGGRESRRPAADSLRPCNAREFAPARRSRATPPLTLPKYLASFRATPHDLRHPPPEFRNAIGRTDTLFDLPELGIWATARKSATSIPWSAFTQKRPKG
jgi:hypothetical protein